MSCHDGATDLGAVFNAGVIDGTGTANQHTPKTATTFVAAGTAISSSGNLSTDLSKTHPVNFVVKATGETDGQKDLWVGPSAGTTSKMGKTGFEMPLFKATGHADPQSRIVAMSFCEPRS